MFDPLRFATRLKHSGFKSDQAEGMARALADEMGKLLERLATKADLVAVRADLESVKRDLEAQIAALSAGMDALEAKVDALAMQLRFMFAMLAVLLALGLIDTVPGHAGLSPADASPRGRDVDGRPVQEAGTTNSGTRISSRLTPPCTPTCRNGFSSAIRSRMA